VVYFIYNRIYLTISYNVSAKVIIISYLPPFTPRTEKRIVECVWKRVSMSNWSPLIFLQGPYVLFAVQQERQCDDYVIKV